MKFFLACLLFVGAALSNSTHRYAWQPQKQYSYRYESQVDFSIPEIRANQKSGLRLTSILRVQALNDFSLLIKFDQPRFLTFNGLQEQGRREQHEEPIPQVFRQHLEQPFKVHLKRGVVESLYVNQNEPIAVTNIKKAVLSSLTMDLSAMRRNEVQSNRLEDMSDEVLNQAPVDESYFTTREQSVHGDCQTSYTVHPLPTYEAMEIEEQLEQQEQRRNQQEHLPGGLSEGRQACRGKRYWQITKTRNFDNCYERPIFQRWSGIKSDCDTSKSVCKDLMNHISATNYIVCGNDIRDFVIRKTETVNEIIATTGWKTEETLRNKGVVSMTLLKEESINQPMPQPQSQKEYQTLYFEYPQQSMESSHSLNKKMSKQEKDKIQQESGIRPVLPQPDLRSAPHMLVPVNIQEQEVYRQAVEQLKNAAEETFKSPESCTSKGDVAGHLNMVAKALRPLSYQQLKAAESRLESEIASKPQHQKQVIRNLFYDVVAMIGTNPSTMLVKERVRDISRVSASQAVTMIQVALTSVRTPTKELLHELVQLVQVDLKQLSHDRSNVYQVAMIHLSNLMHKACVNPTKTSNFPERIYGPFCQRDSAPVQQYIQFLQQELESQQNPQIRLNVLTAIGKLGHIKSVQILSQVISQKQYNEMVRSLAVYSLKRAAKLQPVHVKPLLLAIIDNPAEQPEVRMAAVSVLPYAQPTTAELQKIAVRTWLEPSKEVASFIYSTFRSLAQTKIPELLIVGQRVQPLMTLVKPFYYGMHYSHNSHSSTLVQYLQLAMNQEFSWTKSPKSVVPSRHSESSTVYGKAFQLSGWTWTTFTRGMDKWVNYMMQFTRRSAMTSQQVKKELEKIQNKLSIESQSEQRPQIFQQFKFFEYEQTSFFDQDSVMSALNKIAEEMEQESIAMEKKFEVSKVMRPFEVEGLGPSDTGFPIYIEKSIPIVWAIKGYGKVEMQEEGSYKVPKMLKGKIIPVVNIKMEAHTGVISPFNNELIGGGFEAALHYAAPLEMSLKRKLTQVTLSVQIPQELKNEFEAIHLFLTPYTVKKDLRKIQPVSKSSNLRKIVSGQPLKEVKKNIGQALELDAKLLAESDAKFTDMYSYFQKIRQHSAASLINSFYLPSTLRMSSVKILFNPQQSRTKEIALTIGMVKVSQQKNGERKIESMLSLEPKEVDLKSHIEQICIETFPHNPAQFTKCMFELSELDFVTKGVDSVCSQHNFARCQQLEAVCHKAQNICEQRSGFRQPECQQNMRDCLRRVKSIDSLHKTSNSISLEKEDSVVTLKVDADLHGSNKQVSTAMSFGIKKMSSTPTQENIRVVSDVEVKTSSSPVYEIKFESEVKVPRVNTRWNLGQILEEAIELVSNGKLQFGYENRQREIIQMKSQMVKSEEQKRSVRSSPEYQRCNQIEQEGKKLVNVCEFTRHQAASIDELKTEVQMPRSMYKYPTLLKVGQYVKALFVAQLSETESQNQSESLLKIRANVSRVGDEAQLEAEIFGRKYSIKNIRMPWILKGVFPTSLRNPLSYNIMQKLTRHQIPASCRVEPQYISTFDNKTYSYQLNDCYHLLFKDCSKQIPVAVLAKNTQGQQKQVKILAGPSDIIITPELKIQLIFNGQKEQVEIQAGQTKTWKAMNGKVVLQIKKYQDNVILVNAIQESLWVLFDGQRVEVSGSYMLRSRACGLCGDLNGENTADLKTPQQCVMSRPKYAAYSYMIEESCQGIPSQDRPEYQREKSECIKKEYIPTPLRELTRVVASQATQVTKPMLLQHLVFKQPKSGLTCLSVQRLRVCSKVNKNESQEPRPVKVQPRRVQYVCYDSNTRLAQQLEQRARASEALELTAYGKVYSFSKIDYEPTQCERQSNQL